MSIRRIFLFLLVAAVFVVAAVIPTNPNEEEYYTISGRVYNNNGVGLGEVVLDGFPPGEIVETVGDGSYSAQVPLGWSGTVVPTLSGYTFLPSSRDYTNVTAALENQNYTAYEAPDIIVGRNVNMVAGQTLPDGDPYLQRQNEPSMAVSTRNPLHLLAGANDYRTVDMPTTEGPIPGQITSGDGWLGVFKSFNGGESWKSTLLPGFPQDLSQEGSESPLSLYGTGSDPTVRAGPNGLFYYSGIAFDRGKNGLGILFVARFIDNNFTTLSDPDPIKYLGAIKIDEGTAGQFADKPWIAVDKPRNGVPVQIYTPNAPVQEVPSHNVYIVYSVFLGETPSGDHSKIMFARSTDCGTTFEPPHKISEGQHRNQGTVIAISPQDGTIYVAWRRFVSSSQPDAIMMCKSEDFGLTFNKAVEVATIHPFDQFVEVDQDGNYIEKFRTYAFPALAVDHNGVVYVAWADRGGTAPYNGRIVIKTSPDGIDWSGDPVPIDDFGDCGHQFMPSMAYAAGKLMATWYDSRASLGNKPGDCGYEIYDPGPSGKPHTIDVRIAQASPGLAPSFEESLQVSKYLHSVETDYGPPPVSTLTQRQYNPPNYPLFVGGTLPFIGDYIDIAPAPAFLFDPETESWRFNTGYTPTEQTPVLSPDTFHVTWTDNRDVHPPPGPDYDWTKYNPPTLETQNPDFPEPTPCSYGDRTGMRNQNIYSSAITKGIIVGAPVNTKQLIAPPPQTVQGSTESYEQKITFLVFVKNLTEIDKHFRLKIDPALNMTASFWEEWPLGDGECPFINCGYDEVDLLIEPHSTSTLTVFVEPLPTNSDATFGVSVTEIGGDFQDYIILNPDPVNTNIVPVPEDGEYHTPNVLIGPPSIYYYTDPNALSENIVYLPNFEYILNYANPDIVTPAYRTPAYRTGNIVNPAYRTSLLEDFSDGEVTDIQWRITNNNNTASAYSFLPVGEIPVHPEEGEEVAYQLLIYKVNGTPTSYEECELIEEEHHELVYSTPAYRTPAYRTPAYRTPAYRTPAYRTNTLSLAPGESAICALRLISSTSNPFDATEYATTVAVEAVPQAANPNGIIEFTTSLYIISDVLPEGTVGDSFTFTFEAYGGKAPIHDDRDTPDPGDDILKYNNWSLIPPFPPGFDADSLSSAGILTGTPDYVYDLDVDYPKDYYFTVEVKDISDPQQTARRKFKFIVNCAPEINASATGGGAIDPSGTVPVKCGLSQAFDMIPANECYYLAYVLVDGDSVGAEDPYTFTSVTKDHIIEAIFAQKTYIITASATAGGTISPSGSVNVPCEASQTFDILPDPGYQVMYVLVDGKSVGAVTSYEFLGVSAPHTIHAAFGWVKRYNNEDVNKSDEPSDIAVDPSGNAYVTGFSSNGTDNDYATIKYLSNGTTITNWGTNGVVRYDGGYGNDEASALALDGSGNVLVTGYSFSRNKGEDFYTIIYDNAGVGRWSARYDGPAHKGDTGNDIAVDASRNFYVTGDSFRGMKIEHADYCTVKFNSSGEVIWDARYDARRNGYDVATAIALDLAGNVYMTGSSEYSLSKNRDALHYDYFTIKYNPNNGRIVWSDRYDNTDVENAQDKAADIAVDSFGNVYVTGKSEGSGTDFDYLTIKYNPQGELDDTWGDGGIARYGGIGVDEAVALALFEDESGKVYVYVTGKSEGVGTGFDYVTIKYDPQGQLDDTWGDENSGVVRFHGGYGADEAVDLALDSFGNVFVTGTSLGNGAGSDYYTIKYDSSGTVIWTARYNNDSKNGIDEAVAIAIFEDAGYVHVYVTGRSEGVGTGFDYATIKYEQ